MNLFWFIAIEVFGLLFLGSLAVALTGDLFAKCFSRYYHSDAEDWAVLIFICLVLFAMLVALQFGALAALVAGE